MQKRTLPLSILIGAALTIPSLAIAAPVNTTSVDRPTATTDNMLQTEVGSSDVERVSTQPSPFELNETKTYSLASMNNHNNKVATRIEAMQDPQQDMQDSEEDMLDPQHNMQDPQHNMQDPQRNMQDPQRNMQDPQQDMQDSEEDMLDSEEDM